MNASAHTAHSDPQLPPRQICPPPRLGPVAALATAGMVLIAVMGWLLHGSTFDLAATQAANRTFTGTTRQFFNVLYAALLGRNLPMVLLAGLAVVGLLSRRILRPLIIALTIASTWALVFIPKALVGRPRPDWDFLTHPPHSLPSDMSFPSGHTTFIAVTVAVSLIATYRGLDPSLSRSTVGWKGLSIVAAVGCAAIALIVTTVMARGVHFASDAAGAVIFSFTLAPLVWVLWENLAFRLLFRGFSGPRGGESPVA